MRTALFAVIINGEVLNIEGLLEWILLTEYTNQQMTFGPRWKQIVKLFPQHTEDDVRIHIYSPTFADKWKRFSSTVASGVSLRLITGVLGSVARATAVPAMAAPVTTASSTFVNSSKKVGALHGWYPLRKVNRNTFWRA